MNQALFSLLVFSVLVNIYCFHRLVLLPYWAGIVNANKFNKFYIRYFLERIITRRDGELEKILDEVVAKAREKGFDFVRPRIRVLKKGLGLMCIRVPAMAYASVPRNLIVVDEKWIGHLRRYDLLRIIIAHELGHRIDHQTNRKGHPLFRKIRRVDSELFADAFAAFLYSKKEVVDFREPAFRRKDFDRQKFLALDISIGPKTVFDRLQIENTA